MICYICERDNSEVRIIQYNVIRIKNNSYYGQRNLHAACIARYLEDNTELAVTRNQSKGQPT